MLLDDQLHDPFEPKPIRTHHNRLFAAITIKESGTDRFGITGSELEDMANLNPGFDRQWRPALRAGITRLNLGNIGNQGGLPVAAIQGIAEVVASAVRKRGRKPPEL
jgi:hypothetical protein